jgi:hypothetical protein
MKLTPLHIEILRGARKRVESSQHGFICYAIQDEIDVRHRAESNLLRNLLMFWRRRSIYEKWDSILSELQEAVREGLFWKITVGTWFDHEADARGIKVDHSYRNDLGLYKQIRLAWIDKMIETRTIA